ncbi:Ribonuclease P protein component 3 [Thermococcus sp.]|uniref:Ribonuclease P protein component 3 n=1 Tax=Thermococcus sp. TaxID=35749 RepID=UPI0025CC93CF|nr:Ribonuclease P protein component 3 [Thermococcus sp.]
MSTDQEKLEGGEVSFSRDHFVEMDIRSEDAYELSKEWFDEVVFTKKLVLESSPDWFALKEELRALRQEYGKVALLIVTRKPSLIREIKTRVSKVLIYVQGGDMRVNRTAIEAGVDAVVCPCFGRKDPGFDHILARLAAKYGVAIGFSLSPVLKAEPYEQSHLLRFQAEIWRLVCRYKVPRFITSSAEGKWEVRGPRDLMSFGINLGMGIPQARAGLDFYPGRILSKLK